VKKILLLSILAFPLAACDRELVCPADERDCGGRCVALLADPANCGACGVACGPLEICAAGACACAADVETCGGACADLRIDPANCGACGATCAAELFCDGDGGGCVASCPENEEVCGSSCIDLGANPRHCGACDRACAPGESCHGGVCGADVIVACYYTSELEPLTLDLLYGGAPFPVEGSPGRMAIHADTLYTANGWPEAGVSIVPLGGGPSWTVGLPGTDLHSIAVNEGVLFVTNSGVGTLTLLDLAGGVLDEIPMPDQQSYPNPHGFAFVGSNAYVALNDAFVGQKIVKVDLSSLSACSAPDLDAGPCDGGVCPSGRRCVGGVCRLECGRVAGVIDLTPVPGARDGEGLPFPSGVVAVGSKVFVTLSNLENAQVTCDGYTYTWFVRPAGSGKLAVVDTGAEDAVSVIDLGEDCRSPSGVAAEGTTLWVACGAYCYPDDAPGAVLPVDVSAAVPAVGQPIALAPLVPGEVAFCGGAGYVTDQRATGAVVRFDPASRSVGAPVAVCGASAYGNALASDVLCAR
jgi:DNA-binding beta-propeller fold protein YncE